MFAWRQRSKSSLLLRFSDRASSYTRTLSLLKTDSSRKNRHLHGPTSHRVRQQLATAETTTPQPRKLYGRILSQTAGAFVVILL